MNNIFLGKPPANIEAWIKSHQPTPAPAYTHAWTTNGVEHLFDVDKLECILYIGYIDDNYNIIIYPPSFSEVIHLESGKWQIKQNINGYDSYSYELDEKPVFGEIQNFIMQHVHDYDGTDVGDVEFYTAEVGEPLPCQPVDINGNVVNGNIIVRLESDNNSKLTKIGQKALNQCTSLASVTLGNSVTEIGDSAFAACTSLASVTIPDSVTSFGNAPFAACNFLSSVIIAHKTMDEVESMITNNHILGFTRDNELTTTFTCKDGKVDAYYFYGSWVITKIPFNS